MVRAKGCYLYDSKGKKYADFESGDWAAALGHSHKRITKTLKNKCGLFVHDGLRSRNRESEILAVELLEICGFKGGACAFLNSGSEAVNLAIQLARELTGRKKILKIDNSYLSAYGFGRMTEDNPDLINIKMDDMSAIDDLPFDGIAAFAFEAGNARGLVRLPSAGFIKRIAENVRTNGGMLLANEVTCGMGRTGEWFGYAHYDYSPDIITLGKGLGNGYPVSGIAVSADTLNKFGSRAFRYAQSHQNDPLGCAVALEVINTIKQNDFVRACRETGDYFLEKLMFLQYKFPGKILDVRGRGLMLAFDTAPEIDADNIYLKMIDRGFLIGCTDNTLRFMPPFIIKRKLIDSLIKNLTKILEVA